MTGGQVEAALFSRFLLRQAGWGALALAGAGLSLGLDIAGRSSVWSRPAVIALGAALACGAGLLALSLRLGLDALLFRLIASHDDEVNGCRAVDEVLSRMRLRPRPDRVRGLAERIAGTRRLVLRQRILLAGFGAAAALTLLARNA